jgi:hypothetical protein
LGPCLIRRFHAHRSMIVQAYIRYSAWTVRKPPADLLLFTLADGDQWGGHRGVILQAHFRSVAHAATQWIPPWTPRFVWAVRVSRRRPLSAGPSSYLAPLCVLARWTIAYASLVHIVDETGESLYGLRLSSLLFAKGSWTKWAGRDLFRHCRFVTRACQSSRCSSSHLGPIAWVGWCASG